jgi:flavin-dependent dehydrogenase
LKIAIVGAGATGAYLFGLLTAKGHSVDIFDTRMETRCGISPCAWGTSRGFTELVKASGLKPEKYILRRFDYVIMDGLRIRADLMTFDKKRLIKDLLKGVEIQYSRPDAGSYDRIVDATGVSRAYLPAIRDDIILSCIQYRIYTESVLENRIRLGGIGFAWCFPLGDNEYHIGCGSLLSDPDRILKELGWIGKRPSKQRILCACRGTIRLTGPQYSRPFVSAGLPNEVWGVGEAIGCVAPLAGDGVVPGMKSVKILLEWWDDPDRYTKAILKEFAWMKSERKVIDKLRRNEALDLKDAWVLRKNSRRMEMQVGLKEAGKLLKHLK